MKKKFPTFRVTIEKRSFYTIDIDVEDPDEAMKTAIDEIAKDPESYIISGGVTPISIFINDKDSKNFVPYVAEYIERKADG